MSTIINADTSDGLKFTSDTSGEIKLQSAGTDIATVNSSGITMASGKVLAPTGPSFRATLSANQTGVGDATWTKVEIDTEDWDTDSCFDTTLYRFTPTVSGYYQFNGSILFGGTARSASRLALYKNGSVEWEGNTDRTGSSAVSTGIVSGLIYCNGSTDYVELYGYINNSTADRQFNETTTSGVTSFSGYLARAA